MKSQDSGALESQIILIILRDLSHQSLEGKLTNQQIRALLVLANLAQCHRPLVFFKNYSISYRTVTMRLLDTTRGRRRLAGRFSRQQLSFREWLLAWCLATFLKHTDGIILIERANPCKNKPFPIPFRDATNDDLPPPAGLSLEISSSPSLWDFLAVCFVRAIKTKTDCLTESNKSSLDLNDVDKRLKVLRVCHI